MMNTIRPQRAQDLTPEGVFAQLWEEYNVAQSAVNFGHAALTLILNTRELRAGPVGYRPPADEVSERDAQVAQAIIQWLGTLLLVAVIAEGLGGVIRVTVKREKR
jgi:hypothetical protein